MAHGDGGGGGGRSSSRLRDRLVRMFRPGSLLRSTCNNNTVVGGGASSCASSSSSPAFVAGAGAASTAKSPPPQAAAAASACSSSRALLAPDNGAATLDRDSFSFLASSRRDHLVARTESFSTAVDRLHHGHRRHGRDAPPLSRFSVDADRSRREKKSPLGGKSERTVIRMKLLSNPYGFSSSDEDHTDVFSSDGEDAAADLAGRGGVGSTSSKRLLGSSAETFFSSSRSFSSDSSEFYTKKKQSKKKPPAAFSGSSRSKPPKPPRATTTAAAKVHPAGSGRRRHSHRRTTASSCDTCGVRDGFRPVVAAAAAAEEQVRKGFAVVKRSRDPYADFRSSMVEMIVGKQLLGATDMERLLRSYLALNAPRHHPVILQAFSDIWVVVHGG